MKSSTCHRKQKTPSRSNVHLPFRQPVEENSNTPPYNKDGINSSEGCKSFQLKLFLDNPVSDSSKKNQRNLAYKRYTKDQLEQAVNFVMDNHVSVAMASNLFKVPSTTISDRLRKLDYRSQKKDPNMPTSEYDQVIKPYIESDQEAEFLSQIFSGELNEMESSDTSHRKTCENQAVEDVIRIDNNGDNICDVEFVTITKNDDDRRDESISSSISPLNNLHQPGKDVSQSREGNFCEPDDIAVMRGTVPSPRSDNSVMRGTVPSPRTDNSVMHGTMPSPRTDNSSSNPSKICNTPKKDNYVNVLSQQVNSPKPSHSPRKKTQMDLSTEKLQEVYREHPEKFYIIHKVSVKMRKPLALINGSDDGEGNNLSIISCVNGLGTLLPPFVVLPDTKYTHKLDTYVDDFPVCTHINIDTRGVCEDVLNSYILDHFCRFAQLGTSYGKQEQKAVLLFDLDDKSFPPSDLEHVRRYLSNQVDVHLQFLSSGNKSVEKNERSFLSKCNSNFDRKIQNSLSALNLTRNQEPDELGMQILQKLFESHHDLILRKNACVLREYLKIQPPEQFIRIPMEPQMCFNNTQETNKNVLDKDVHECVKDIVSGVVNQIQGERVMGTGDNRADMSTSGNVSTVTDKREEKEKMEHQKNIEHVNHDSNSVLNADLNIRITGTIQAEDTVPVENGQKKDELNHLETNSKHPNVGTITLENVTQEKRKSASFENTTVDSLKTHVKMNGDL